MEMTISASDSPPLVSTTPIIRQGGHADHAAGPDSRDGEPALALTLLYFESALFFPPAPPFEAV